MGSVNKVILIGRLGKDVELRSTQGGKAVAGFSMATNDSKDKEKTEWHNVVLWEKQAEVAARYLKKGSQVYVEGRLQTRKWEDKEGAQRYTTEVVGHTLQFLDAKGSGSDEVKEDDLPF